MIQSRLPIALATLFLLLPSLIFTSAVRAQDTTTVYFNKKWKPTTQDSAYYYRKAWKTKQSGLWEVHDYFPTHVLQMSGFSTNPENDSSSEGHTVYYYPSGKHKKECSYVHNKENGLSQAWYESGSLAGSGNFDNGKETGEWKYWHENGQLKSKGIYREPGNSTWEYWYDNGKLYARGSYKEEKETGEWKFWHENGQLSDSGSFVNGEKTGTWYSWFENGQPAATGSYSKDKRTGEWKGWYDNGHKNFEAVYVNGGLDNKSTWYFSNGQRAAEEYYDRDIFISGKYWDENGRDVPAKEAKERMPYFRDETNTQLMQYLSANVRYPKEAVKNNIEGRVKIKFIVREDGSISDAVVEESADPLLDAEALRVVSGMPKWVPGRQHNRLVSMYFTLPVTFRLE